MRLALLSPFVPWSFLIGHPRSVGPSQLWLRQSEKSSERGFLRTSVRDMGSESVVVLWPGLPIGEAVRRWAGDRSERSGQRGGPKSEAGAIPPWPGLPV